MDAFYGFSIKTGADSGFPVGGGINPRGGGGVPTYDFAKFSEKLHEIEKNFGRGRTPGHPLGSTTDDQF